MKVIHTSDWHLGQHFMGKTRQKEHQQFLHWLVQTIQDRKADALVVAGDIFDTGTPPSYARTLYNEFIVSMQGTGCRNILILGGNHDAAATLNEARGLLEYLNTRVVAGVLPEATDHVRLFLNQDGTPGLLVCAIPFLRPADLTKSIMGQSGADRQAAMASAIKAFYEKVYDSAKHKQEQLALQGINIPVMATGHLTVVGGKTSESVRDIYIGSLDAFPADGFPPVDYLALGHLHRGQQLRARDNVRYSGSPIPLSFDEAGHPKQILEVDFNEEGQICVSALPVPVFRRLVTIEGSLEEIENALEDVKKKSADPKEKQNNPDAGVWLEARVNTDHHLPDLPERIREMVKNTFETQNPPELLRVCRQEKHQHQDQRLETRERLEALTPHQVFTRRLDQEDLPRERLHKLQTLFDQVLNEIETENPEEIPDSTPASAESIPAPKELPRENS